VSAFALNENQQEHYIYNRLITMTTFKPTRNERLLEFTPGRPIAGN